MLFSLLAVAVADNVCFAQSPMPMMTKEASLFTIQGTIEYKEALGGYYFRCVKPGGEWMILNKNPELKKYMESKKTLTIEGILKGPERITILEIDGKEYVAEKPAS